MTRRTWVYTEGGRPLAQPYEAGADWRNVSASTGDLGKFEYSNLQATDGTDISSRTKRNAYMKATGVADVRDFTETTRKAAEARQEWREGRSDTRETADMVGRAAYALRRKGRG